MKRKTFMDLFSALTSYVSGDHGDHEGGFPGNCPDCRILSLLECIGGVALDKALDNWDDDVNPEALGKKV